MEIQGLNTTYDNLRDAMLNEYFQCHLYEVFTDADEIDFEKADFHGKYICRIKYCTDLISDYEFVYVRKYDSLVTGKNLIMCPIYFPDELIYEIYFDENEDYIDLEWFYDPSFNNKFDTDTDELISFDGRIYAIEGNEKYVNFNGRNYEILKNCEDIEGKLLEISKSKIEKFSENIWDEIKKNKCNGKITINGLTNIGETFTETYTISHIENDTLFCNPLDIPTRNSLNVPEVLEKEDYEKYNFIEEMGVRIVNVYEGIEFFPGNLY